MHPLEGLAREAARSQAVLIGYHHEGKAGTLQFQQSGHHAGHEPNFFQTIDLLIRHLLIQGAVAIKKQDASAVHERATQAISASFSARVPTDTRSERGRAGLARKSRTISPPAML